MQINHFMFLNKSLIKNTECNGSNRYHGKQCKYLELRLLRAIQLIITFRSTNNTTAAHNIHPTKRSEKYKYTVEIESLWQNSLGCHLRGISLAKTQCHLHINALFSREISTSSSPHQHLTDATIFWQKHCNQMQTWGSDFFYKASKIPRIDPNQFPERLKGEIVSGNSEFEKPAQKTQLLVMQSFWTERERNDSIWKSI